MNVVAQQFAWQFSYDDGKTWYPMLRLPVDRKVKLYMTANDVIHSFWVPQFAQKQDLVPGTEQTLVITPNKIGSWPVICTELCGLGHSLMRSQAIVMTEADFDTWRKNASKPAGGGGGGDASGEATFISKGCGACHTFSAIPSAQGKVGPSLDNLSEAAEAAGHAARGLHPRVDRRPERLSGAGVQPAERDAVRSRTRSPRQTSTPLCSIWPRTRTERTR